MAKARKKTTKKAAEAATDSMFDDGAGEQAAALEKAAEAEREESAEDRLAAELSGEQPPRHVPDPRGAERAWESYPPLDGACPECGGKLRGEGAVATCRRGHETELRRDAGPGEAPPPATVPTSSRRNSRGARVVFHEQPTTRLEQVDYDHVANMEHEGLRFDGAFVKVSAALRPSEREAFDGRELKERLRGHGAVAVLLAVRPVAEAPDKEAKAETSTALRPEDAIAAWFDGLPVPEDEQVEAKEKALEILASEGG